VVRARPNRARVEFVVLDRLDEDGGTTRVSVELRGVVALPGDRDVLTPWVGRTMTAVLPSGASCLAVDPAAGAQVSSGLASLVGPGEIRLTEDEPAAQG
jgi:hypothetical protein